MTLTQITEKGIKDGEIINADINASAAIDVSKLSGVLPLAGGTLTGDLTISNTAPSIALIDTDSNSDFSIFGSQGEFRIRDQSNTTNRLTINSSGGVGIGTSGIDRRFHVEGTDNVLGKFQNNQSICLIEFEDTDTTAGNRPSIGSDANNAIVFAGGSERVRIDSSGDVLIGTTTSSNSKLTVFGTDAAAIFQGSNTGTGSGQGFTVGNNGNVNSFVWNYENGFMHFATNNTERMRIDSSGRLLVGTTNTTTVGTVNKNLIVGSTTNAEEVAVTLNVMEGTNNRRVKFFLDDDDGVYGFDTTSSTGTAQFVVRHATSEKMRIDSSGRLLLGTTTEGNSSADDLTIASSTSCGISIRSGTSNSGNVYFSDGTSGASEYRGFLSYSHTNNDLSIGVDAATRLQLSSSEFTLFGTYSGNAVPQTNLIFGIKNSNGQLKKAQITSNKISDISSTLEFGTTISHTYGERMRIHSDGNVGINQTNPNKAKLHVVGDDTDGDIIAKFKSGGGGANSKAYIALISGYPDTANDIEGHAYIGVERSGSGNNTNILFSPYNGGSAVTERLRIRHGGGICFNGDTAAANALDDYEEGTWTATAQSGSGGFQSCANNVCRYVKVGSLVHISGRFSLNNHTGAGGELKIEGLPFAKGNPSGDGNSAGIQIYVEGAASNITNDIVGLVLDATTQIFVRRSGTTSSGNDMSGRTDTGTTLLIGGAYITSG